MEDTATLGYCRNVLSFIYCGACTSSEISSFGSVGEGCSSHPRKTFTHNAKHWSHVGRPLLPCSLCIHLWHHAALTANRRVIPRKVARDNSGCSQSMTVESDLGPVSMDVGSMHWAAMCAPTEMFLHPVTMCCDVSCCPQMGY